MVRHLAGAPVDNVQRCEWCKKVLQEWWPELNTQHPRELFWKPGSEVIEDGGSMWRKREDEDLVLCCVPEVESVHIQ